MLTLCNHYLKQCKASLSIKCYKQLNIYILLLAPITLLKESPVEKESNHNTFPHTVKSISSTSAYHTFCDWRIALKNHHFHVSRVPRELQFDRVPLVRGVSFTSKLFNLQN